jgi:hypothetical protein
VSFKVYLGVLLSRFSWIFCMEDSTIIARDWWFCFRWFNCWKDFFERETRIQFQKGMFPSRMNSLTLWSFMSNQEFFSSPFLGTSLDNCSLLGFVFRLFKMDSGYLSTWLVGGTCGGILRRWRKMRHWKAYRIWPWPFPIYLFFLVNNNLFIIAAKKIVISLSLAVEDGRAWTERSVICVLFLLRHGLMKLGLSLFLHHTWITRNWQVLVKYEGR